MMVQLVEPFQRRPHSQNDFTRPNRMKRIFRKNITQCIAHTRNDVTLIKVLHCWQSIIIDSPHKMLHFVGDPKLPNALPKFFCASGLELLALEDESQENNIL